MSIQVLKFESLDLIVNSLGIADSFADIASSDEVLEFILLLQVLEEPSSLCLSSELTSSLQSNEVQELILLLQVLESFPITSKRSGQVGLSNFSGILPGDEVLKIILI